MSIHLHGFSVHIHQIYSVLYMNIFSSYRFQLRLILKLGISVTIAFVRVLNSLYFSSTYSQKVVPQRASQLPSTRSLLTSGLDISARPLAQANVKSVGRVQITDHSPVWRVRFFIAKKLIKLQNKRCFYTLFCREISKQSIVHICMAKFYTPNCPKNGR